MTVGSWDVLACLRNIPFISVTPDAAQLRYCAVSRRCLLPSMDTRDSHVLVERLERDDAYAVHFRKGVDSFAFVTTPSALIADVLQALENADVPDGRQSLREWSTCPPVHPMSRQQCRYCAGKGLVEVLGELEECAACDGTGDHTEPEAWTLSPGEQRFHGVDRSRLTRFLERGE